jgi:uncharacterized protein YjaZ
MAMVQNFYVYIETNDCATVTTKSMLTFLFVYLNKDSIKQREKIVAVIIHEFEIVCRFLTKKHSLNLGISIEKTYGSKSIDDSITNEFDRSLLANTYVVSVNLLLLVDLKFFLITIG